MKETVLHTLKKYWGFDSLRPDQRIIVQAILDGEDLLALLPTGGGKSLCFQLPSMEKTGLTLVISPLIALMKDQVENLKKIGIKAAALHSGMPYFESDILLQNALKGYYKFLYISPERLASKNFIEYLPNLNIDLLVIDEAHCISQWGYDFRPPYLTIAECQNYFENKIQTVAFTASANLEVREDIKEKLDLKNPKEIIGNFSRPNLHYGVFNTQSKNTKLLELCKKVRGSIIVFANSRRETEEISVFLSQHEVSTTFYHAGLTTNERSKRQDEWMKNNIRVMVCTNAFGMGVDKPDVRMVLHMQPSASPEAYYQEAGRAGRDLKPAYAILLYNDNDFATLLQRHAQTKVNKEELSNIYNAVLNFIGIPPGGGDQQAHRLNIEDIAKYYSISSARIYNGIENLALLGEWTFNANDWTPATVKIIANAETVYSYKVKNKSHEPILNYIQRAFPGIYSQYAKLNLTKIAAYLHITEKELETKFLELNKRGLTNYIPKNEHSLLFTTQARSVYAEFNMQTLNYIFDKKQSKISKITEYALSENCRNTFWSVYYNLEETKACGHCDNCKKKVILSEKEAILEIKKHICGKPTNQDELLQNLPNNNKSIYVNTIRWLLDYQKIKVLPSGVLQWLKD